MGKLRQFAINFENNQSVFVPGSPLAGQVFIDLQAPMQLKAIKLKFLGKAYVHWTETSGSGENQTTHHYSATQILFDESIILYGQGNGSTTSDRNNLSQGQHIYPFVYNLPSLLPSSFEDGIGYIRYSVKASIDRPWKFDPNTKRVFTVLDVLDLNEKPNMLSPSGDSKDKRLCCWCCRSGPIDVEFHLDRSGYVPGEWIIINGTVTNGSNSKVVKTSAKLLQNVTYHATRKTRVGVNVMNKIEGPGCRRKSSVTWTNERLHIPPLPPTETTHCRIIDINYFIQFEVHLRTCSINLRACAPIIIGTIPLRSLGMYGGQAPGTPLVQPPPLPALGGLENPSFSVDVAPAVPAAIPPPPTYAAAVSGGVNIKESDDNNHTMGDMTYTPQYTYYDWNESAFTYNK